MCRGPGVDAEGGFFFYSGCFLFSLKLEYALVQKNQIESNNKAKKITGVWTKNKKEKKWKIVK